MTASTIPDLLVEAAARYGPRPALAIRRGLRTERWSYRDLLAGSRAAAARISAAGVGPGDQVLAIAPNCPELVIGMFGVWLAGGVLVPIDLRTSPDVIERIREQTEPKLAIGVGSIEGADGVPLLRLDDLALAPREALPTWEREQGPPAEIAQRPLLPEGEGWGEGSSTDRQPPNHPTPPDPLAEIVFTSGTTGAPKGVMLTHGNILANVQAARETLPIRVGERLLSLLPLSHMMEQTAGLLTALASGATVFYATSRRSTALMAAMQRHRIGLLVCVPEVLKLMLAGIEREVDRAGRRAQWRLLLAVADRMPMAVRPLLFRPVHARLGGRLRLILCGGAALDAELWRTWERLGVRVIQGYGATECAPIVTSNRLERRLPGSVGWPVRGVEIRLASDGEVLVRGPNVTPGYWQAEAATREAFEDGWYRGGDLGRIGKAGELYLLGRKKEMIVLPDGRNVFPQDVEDVLKRDAAVRDCVVLGTPRSGGGEEVHAVVIPAAEPKEARAAVRRANGRLGPHEQVTGVSIWTESDFPRTPSLKVKRREVLARLGVPGSAPMLGAAARGAAECDR
jgi:long-chain acyl-CoA synthetase